MRTESADPAALRSFLLRMPKGGELHIHSWGTAFAEDDIRWAMERGFCASLQPVGFVIPPCQAKAGDVKLSASDSAVRDRLVGALTEDSETGPVQARHDHFFDTFWVAEPVITRALAEELALLRATEARQSVSYVEFMSNPDAVEDFGAHAATLAFAPDHLDRAYDALSPMLPDMLRRSRSQIDDRLLVVDRMQGCDAPGARTRGACAVTVRFLCDIMRTDPPAHVFGAMVAAFALVHSDPRYVGLNIVGPEDDPVAIRDYRLHMRMFQFLLQRYPDVHVTMHAGELTPAIAPPSALAFHIGSAVAAGASRIGHGVDIARESDGRSTLATMARRRVALEVLLTSNAVILGVSGARHPLSLYIGAGVPIVLATDDPGVLRTDMTKEYERAVLDQALDYHQLKRASRNGLEYAFLPGRSIWRAGTVGIPGEECIGSIGQLAPDPLCAELLRNSPKATLQWRLERDLARFEDDTLARMSAEPR